MWDRHMPRFVSRDFSKPTPVRLLLKDLGIVVAAGGELPLGTVALSIFERMAAADGGDQDISAVIKQFEG
jgi:3-hydroxyisobutyrate dehydrogenase-like beta-hydroxyacid dehydrogenase